MAERMQRNMTRGKTGQRQHRRMKVDKRQSEDNAPSVIFRSSEVLIQNAFFLVKMLMLGLLLIWCEDCWWPGTEWGPSYNGRGLGVGGTRVIMGGVEQMIRRKLPPPQSAITSRGIKSTFLVRKEEVTNQQTASLGTHWCEKSPLFPDLQFVQLFLHWIREYCLWLFLSLFWFTVL